MHRPLPARWRASVALISLLMWTTPALAQTAEPELPKDDPSELEAQAAMLAAQLEALQTQLDSLRERMAKEEATTRWQGAPTSSSREPGFTFKPRGSLQFDSYYTRNPDNFRQSATDNFGVQSFFRRALIGADGSLPGGFTYSVEFNLTNNSVGYEDLIIRYAVPQSAWQTTIGFQKTLASLDDLTSSRFITFLERASFVEAFGYERRLGVSTRYRRGDLTLMLGLFNEGIQSARTNNGWAIAGRGLYNPKIADVQYHAALGLQYRNAREGAQTIQARARPARGTDVRFVDTSGLAASSDWVINAEFAAIAGPLNVAAELAYNRIHVLAPADNLTLDGPGATSGARLAGDVAFLGGYAEVSYNFTGETRGYNVNDGRFDRLRPANGFDKGGPGAFVGSLRFDYLDLSDSVDPVRVATLGAGGGSNPCFSVTATTCFIDGGKQYTLLGALNWIPIDYVRFVGQVSYAMARDVPPNAARTGLGSRISTNPNRLLDDFNIFAMALRAQLDW
jgi:phosphate-selective porin OprO and OprP